MRVGDCAKAPKTVAENWRKRSESRRYAWSSCSIRLIERFGLQRRAVALLELGADLVARRVAVEELDDGDGDRRQRGDRVGEARRIAQRQQLLAVLGEGEGFEGAKTWTFHGWFMIARDIVGPCIFS